MRDFIRDLPSYWPLIVTWSVVGLVLARPLASYLVTRRVIAFALFMSVGFILLATLSPNHGRLSAELIGQCDFSRVGLPSFETLRSDSDALRNIVLFLPLGFLLGLLPRTTRSLAVIAMAFGLTVFVEASQFVFEGLGRGCESADMVDNTIGLVAGLALGIVTSLVYTRSRSTPSSRAD